MRYEVIVRWHLLTGSVTIGALFELNNDNTDDDDNNDNTYNDNTNINDNNNDN